MVIYENALYKEIEHQREKIKRALADPCFSGRERAELTHEYEILGGVLTTISMLSKKTAEGKNEEMVAEAYAKETAKDYGFNPSKQELEFCASLLKRGFKAGMDYYKDKVADNAFVYEQKHRTAMILACECIRNHGWFGRERDFIELWGFIEGTDDYETLFNGTNHNKKVKLLKAEENG